MDGKRRIALAGPLIASGLIFGTPVEASPVSRPTVPALSTASQYAATGVRPDCWHKNPAKRERCLKRYAMKKLRERMEKKGKKWMGPPRGCFKGWHTPECKDKRVRKKQEWKRHIPRMPDWPPPEERPPQDPYPPSYGDPGSVQPQH
ncbi:hypothetical protein ACGF0J_20485 [Nonomuraea sp. NPDC047897]|uniref:hypothetical protein n=1 Tax=Nonomuraea sp. NPDC047897 TaxID=3364346 RepID=UPI00371B8732